MKVFLGGTCGQSTWRGALIPLLKIDYYNPVVPHWTSECQVEEIRQRETCDFVLYVITPAMSGVYSIAEVVEDSIKRPEKTVFLVLEEDCTGKFTPHQLKSLKQTAKMISENGGWVCTTLEGVAWYLNTKAGL